MATDRESDGGGAGEKAGPIPACGAAVQVDGWGGALAVDKYAHGGARPVAVVCRAVDLAGGVCAVRCGPTCHARD
jgi:hypothetical protein